MSDEAGQAAGGPASGVEVAVVTGLSGAGRSTAAKCLEDLGWFVVDNLPPELVATMVELGAQARGAINGRDFVLPDDIKDIAPHVLTHRVILRPNAELRGLTPSAVVEEVIATEAVPMTSRRLA